MTIQTHIRALRELDARIPADVIARTRPVVMSDGRVIRATPNRAARLEQRGRTNWVASAMLHDYEQERSQHA
jgi:hypothetical protein